MDNLKRNELLRKIQELEFAAVDLNLFLDTHPTNQPALSDYNAITEELKRLKKIYETNFGPLSNFGNSPSQYPWRWIDEPWPWEIKG